MLEHLTDIEAELVFCVVMRTGLPVSSAVAVLEATKARVGHRAVPTIGRLLAENTGRATVLEAPPS